VSSPSDQARSCSAVRIAPARTYPVRFRPGEGAPLCGGLGLPLLGSGPVGLLGLEPQHGPGDQPAQVARAQPDRAREDLGLDRVGELGGAVPGGLQ